MGARVAILVLLLQLPLLALAQTAVPPDPPAQGAGSQLRLSVRRVHQPVLIEAKGHRNGSAEVCSALAPEQVLVFEDGEPLVVTALGPGPQPRIHALLIDISGSMRDDIFDAKRAANAYIESLPAADAVMLAAFDESMVLAAPVTTDRAMTRAAIDQLDVGHFTSLWDSLTAIIRYLAALDGEKVIVLVSDGNDTTSSHADVFENLLDVISVTPDLVIFPIGLGLASNGGFTEAPTWARLHQLAQCTGGEFFRIQKIVGLKRILRRINRRVDDRLYVSYIPRPFGEGPRDDPASAEFRWRRVKIRAASGAPCRIVPLGRQQRLEMRPGGQDKALRIEPLRAGEPSRLWSAISAPCRTAAVGLEIEEKLRVGGQSFGAKTTQRPSLLYTLASREQLIGHTTDVIVERGPLFSRKSYWRGGKYRAVTDRKPFFSPRVIVVDTPPFEFMQSELTRPEELLVYMLERDFCAPVPTTNQPHARAPAFVHGRTFLEIRDFLGRVLYRSYPEYRDWAVSRVERMIDSNLDHVLAGLPQTEELSDDEVRALREAMLSSEIDPDEGHSHLLLAEWLGDVSALDTVQSLERAVMNRLLASEPDPDAEAHADLVLDAWEKLTLWFAPATSVRIVTPLIPVYDPQREVVGFYRFILPRPTMDGPPDEILQDRPLGLLTLRWLLDQPGTSDLIRGRARVASLQTERAKRRETKGSRCRLAAAEVPDGSRRGFPGHKVVIELRGSGADADTQDDRLTLTAYFMDRADEPQIAADEPACFKVKARGAEWAAATAVAVTTAVERADLAAARSNP